MAVAMTTSFLTVLELGGDRTGCAHSHFVKACLLLTAPGAEAL